MRRRGPSVVRQIATLGLAYAVVFGCGSSNDSGSEGLPQFGGTGTGGGSNRLVEGGNIGDDARVGRLNPLCGHKFNCPTNPDDPKSCDGFGGSPVYRPDSGPRGSGGTSTSGSGGGGAPPASGGRGTSGQEGGTRDGGRAPDASGDAHADHEASDAGKPEGGSLVDVSVDGRGRGDRSLPDGSDAPVPDGSGVPVPEGSSGPGIPDADPPSRSDAGHPFSCQVAAPASGTGGATSSEPFYQCLPAGDRPSGSSCNSSADCRPGLACASSSKGFVGQCLPYCCDPTTACDKAWVAGGGDPAEPDSGLKLVCGDRVLIDGPRTTALRVPVCVLADQCKLGDPYPCTGSSCSCRQGEACTVRIIPGDGGLDFRATTDCAPVGKGRSGERCPCAAGYFCSSDGLCSKLCSTDGYGSPCAPGRCQSVAEFPDGWGVCVGPTPASK